MAEVQPQRQRRAGHQLRRAGRTPNTIGVRDSKNPSAGHLTLTTDQFTTLLANVKADKFSL